MIDITAGPPVAEASGDLLAVPVFADRTLGPGAQWAADQLGDWLDAHFDSVEFDGKAGQTTSVPGAGAIPFGSVLFIGLGDEVDAEGLRRAAGMLGRAAGRAKTVVTTLHAVDVEGAAEYVSLGFLLGQYRFEKYRSESKPSSTESLSLAGADGTATAHVARGVAIARGTTLARDLVNEPPIGKPPVEMARIAESLASDGSPLQVKVYDENESRDERFGGLLGVAAGATNPPRMVVFSYEPDDAVAFVAFVGKGIVFDSGGLSLKPPAAMETMKTDMSGAAAVFGAMQAIAELGLPVRVMGIAPITENMPSGSATRPGDVLTIRNGKTIEVLNTDAEGRLVLADGLSLAAEAEPDLIVDVATLTGACNIALGGKIAGLFANDDDAASRVEAAAKRAGEDVWRLPMPSEYRKLIDSPIADMKNTGGRYGGAITAALLLKEFVGEIPWVHLDIAGPARASDAENYVTKGGTGFGVRTLVEIAGSFAE